MKKEKIDALIKKFEDLEWAFPWERGLTTEDLHIIMGLLITERNKNGDNLSEM